MNKLFAQRNLLWLNARIGEAEARIDSDKRQLAMLENNEDNTSYACRRLATATEYLQLLNVRRNAVIEAIRQMGE